MKNRIQTESEQLDSMTPADPAAGSAAAYGDTGAGIPHRGFLTVREWILWGVSVTLILSAFFLFGAANPLTLVASLIGVTSLIFNARGNPIGQALMIVFSVLYGVISYSFRYFGEMITYLGMTAPMAVAALVSWLRHPFAGRHSEVRVGRLSPRELPVLAVVSALVTFGFYWILRAFDTPNLPLSTLSVTTSFLAVWLTFRRSPWYALAYAANDAVLIALWVLAAVSDRQYVSVVVCFAVFFFHDLYGLYCWFGMRRRQETALSAPDPDAAPRNP